MFLSRWLDAVDVCRRRKSSAGLQCSGNPFQDIAGRRLIVNGIEGRDQFNRSDSFVSATSFTSNRTLLIPLSFALRFASVIASVEKSLTHEAALRERFCHEHQCMPTSATYIKDAYTLVQIVDCIQ